MPCLNAIHWRVDWSLVMAETPLEDPVVEDMFDDDGGGVVW